MRAYPPPRGIRQLVGLTSAEAETRVPEHRLFIHRVRRAGQHRRGAARNVAARRRHRRLVGTTPGHGGPDRHQAEETDDKELLDVAVTIADVLVMNRKLGDRTLADPRPRIGRAAFICARSAVAGRTSRLQVASRCSAATCSGSSVRSRSCRGRPRALASSWRRARKSISSCWDWPFSWAALRACSSPLPWEASRSP